ncbi:pyridoxal phosphate-dependent decarboxylase family protein [Protofrankia symbiont of Coriaria ruscifolia]|uniref:pyridoxal phosphate-dependent decarboxylase family protein n=1 Tax=Protofrankia symbiont of Coriaria ruscifolia TaxID=1306542 RepID=UPI00324226C4
MTAPPGDGRSPTVSAGAGAVDAGLAGGAGGIDRLRSLVAIALDGLAAGTSARGGPLPPGGPAGVSRWVHDVLEGQRRHDHVSFTAGVPAGSGVPPRSPESIREVREAQVPGALGGRSGRPPDQELSDQAAGPPGVPSAESSRELPAQGPWALPPEGVGTHAALSGLTRMLAQGAADPADPACAAHLHCPPLAVAVAADLVVSALNPSLDSWDQAPAATAMETEVVAALAGLVGFDPVAASGAITTGGTASNLTALMLARDNLSALTTAAPAAGLPGRPAVRVFCSSAAHFSIGRAAAVLGLGPDAVVPVATDGTHRLDPSSLEVAILRARRSADRAGRRFAPVVVATAGTTDIGAFDPLRAVTEVARAHGAWVHVDAAYGGGALLSDRLAPLLDGIAEADSVALDLHKLGWQPIAAGVLLTRDAGRWATLEHEVAYLNATDDALAGYPSLLGRSLRTSRRADAFKIAVTFRALGRHGLGRLVDACHDLACHAATRISSHPRLELAAPVTLSTVVFRYLPVATATGTTAGTATGTVDVDGINARLRRRLLESGRAVVGRTEFGPDRSVHLKLTLLNPDATASDVDALLGAVVRAGDAEDRG